MAAVLMVILVTTVELIKGRPAIIYGTLVAAAVLTQADRVLPPQPMLLTKLTGEFHPSLSYARLIRAAFMILLTGQQHSFCAQAQAIISVAAHDNQYFVASYRAPNLYMPSVLNQTISFDIGQQLIDYFGSYIRA